MKIRAHASVAPSMIEPAKTRTVSRADRVGRAEPATASADAASTAASDDKVRGDKGSKAAPPGLERVLARLQAMDEGQRTAGQSNAMDRIGRNLARYLETQGLTAPTPATPPSAQPVADAGSAATGDAATVDTAVVAGNVDATAPQDAQAPANPADAPLQPSPSIAAG